MNRGSQKRKIIKLMKWAKGHVGLQTLKFEYQEKQYWAVPRARNAQYRIALIRRCL